MLAVKLMEVCTCGCLHSWGEYKTNQVVWREIKSSLRLLLLIDSELDHECFVQEIFFVRSRGRRASWLGSNSHWTLLYYNGIR